MATNTTTPPASAAAGPTLASDHDVFHAWREDSPGFDGNALYTDLDTAKHHAATDYTDEEYGYPDDEDDPADQPNLTWTEHHDRWALLDSGSDTGVRVEKRPVYRPVNRTASPAPAGDGQ